jgi:hypothetical protein
MQLGFQREEHVVSIHRNPHKFIRTRAVRFDTWPELQRAVLKWCGERIAEENPSFSVTCVCYLCDNSVDHTAPFCTRFLPDAHNIRLKFPRADCERDVRT